MADAPDSTDYSAQIDKACRIYTDLGFTPLRIASQLIRSGYPQIWLEHAFRNFRSTPCLNPRTRVRSIATASPPVMPRRP